LKNSKNTVQKRQMQILNYLQQNGQSSVTSLSELFHVSSITVRRDLSLLASKNLIVQQHGSARIAHTVSTDEEPSANSSGNLEKLAIAEEAASFIGNGDSVFLNSSETASYVLSYLKGKSVMVITNNGRSLNIERDPGVELVLTGGEVYGKKHSLVGEFAINALTKVTASKCIIGVSGISASGGITSKVLQETTVNRMMLSHCSGPKIIVADSSKIGVEQNFFTAEIGDITMLITDNGAAREEIERIKEAGVQVVLVDPEQTGISKKSGS
jgi:DeoR family transcriptional regulator, fructose operon transcriptional repressor